MAGVLPIDEDAEIRKGPTAATACNALEGFESSTEFEEPSHRATFWTLKIGLRIRTFAGTLG